MKEFYSKLDSNKIKINRNKNPVKMELFLSFLTVGVERSISHLGYSNGWTQLIGDNSLEIGGGKVGSVEYLNSIQYGKNLDNPYNNYVNPFYLFEIFNDEGKKYFLEYYSSDIERLLEVVQTNADQARISAERAEVYKEKVVTFWEEIK